MARGKMRKIMSTSKSHYEMKRDGHLKYKETKNNEWGLHFPLGLRRVWAIESHPEGGVGRDYGHKG